MLNHGIGASKSNSSVGTQDNRPQGVTSEVLMLTGSRPQTTSTKSNTQAQNARKMKQRMRDLDGITSPEGIDAQPQKPTPNNARQQDAAPVIGWVLDFGDTERTQKDPLQINGIGTGLGGTLSNIKSAQTLANPDVMVPGDYWKSQSLAQRGQTPSQKFKQKGKPIIPMTMPDRSGSLEDALVIRSKAAIKRNEKQAESQLPIHRKHTVASQGKVTESPTATAKQQSVFLDEPKRYEGGNSEKKGDLNISTVSSSLSEAPKGLLKLKIVEFHSQKHSASDVRSGGSRNFYSQQDVIHEVSCSNGSVEIEMYPEGKVDQSNKNKRPSSTASFVSKSLPYQQSHKRLPQRGPTIVEFGNLVDPSSANDENRHINQMDDYEAAEQSHRMAQMVNPAYKKNNNATVRPMTSSNSQPRDLKSQNLALMPYKPSEYRPEQSMGGKPPTAQSSKERNPRRKINPHVADVERIKRYSQIQRPFSVKNTTYQFQGQPPLPKPQTSQQMKRTFSGNFDEDQDKLSGLDGGFQNSIFQTQLYQQVEAFPVGSSTNILPNYRTLQPSTASVKSATYTTQGGTSAKPGQDQEQSDLTREQIFNYLQNKKKNPTKAPYGIIQRDTDVLDDQQRQIDLQRQTMMAATAATGSLTAGSGNVNYINIYMQQPTQSTQLSPTKNLRSSMGDLMSDQQPNDYQSLETVLDHTNQQFLAQLDIILKRTPLQEIIKDGFEKEKRKLPSFLYFHPTSNDGGEPVGDDIGFEENNKERDRQSRTHAKLLDQLLQDILTGKFRDSHWFTGIQVHKESDTHWLNGSLKDRTDKYIDGADLARLFREKLQPQLFAKKRRSSLSPRASSPQFAVEEVDDSALESSPSLQHGKKPTLESALVPYQEQVDGPLLALTSIPDKTLSINAKSSTPQVTIIDTQPMKSLLQTVKDKVSEHKEIQMDHIYEMNKQRFDDQVVSTYIHSDRMERGKKDLQGGPKVLEDEETAKSRKLMQMQGKHKHTMGTLEKAKEHFQTTKEKHRKEMDSMSIVVDSNLQFPPSGQKYLSTSTLGGGFQSESSPRRVTTSPRKGSPRRSAAGAKPDSRVHQRSMIYTCFLEMVRQIGSRQKDQGVLLLKIWHAYFDQFDYDLDRIVSSVKSKQRELDQILGRMKGAFGELIKQKEHTEQRFLDLNLRIEELQKDLNVSRLIQKRDGEIRKEATDNFDRMKNLFPRCEEYLEKIKLNEIEATRTDVGRLKYLCQKLKKPYPNDLELPLILDLDVIMSSIKAKTCHEMNAMYEHEILAGTYELFKADTAAKFHYMESLLIEKEEELRLEEEKRYTAEDCAIQTDLQANEILAMQAAMANQSQPIPEGRGRKGRMTTVFPIGQHPANQFRFGEEGESPGMASNTENGVSPLIFEQRMNGIPQTPSVNVTPYEMLTPGQQDANNVFSTAKKKGKLPKKNLISSVAQSISKGKKSSKGGLDTPGGSSQLLSSKEKRGSVVVTLQGTNLIKLNPIGNDDGSPDQDRILLRSNTVTPDLIGRSPEKPTLTIDNKNFMHSPEALGKWSTTQGRIEIIEEEKANDELDQELLQAKLIIKECPSDQEEDSFNLGASFDHRSANKRLSPPASTITLTRGQQQIMPGPGSPNTLSDVSRMPQHQSNQDQQVARARSEINNNTSPNQKHVLFDIAEERSGVDRASKRQISQFESIYGSRGEMMSYSSSENESFYSQSQNNTARK